MDKVLTFKQGRVPLLISMPHAGLKLTPAVKAGLIPEAQSLPDTDWHIPQLYDFASELGASTLAAEYSRFVIDLNRPQDDAPMYVGATTGLFPATLFEGVPLFREGQVPTRGACDVPGTDLEALSPDPATGTPAHERRVWLCAAVRCALHSLANPSSV